MNFKEISLSVRHGCNIRIVDRGDEGINLLYRMSLCVYVGLIEILEWCCRESLNHN